MTEVVRTFYDDKNSHIIISDYLKEFANTKCLLLCIGTDRFIGDCLGPLTGTFLTKLNISRPVFGTLENPVHAINLKSTITKIKAAYPDHKIIAIDACIGEEDCIGSIQVRNGCIHPGKGVGKKLPPIGDISIVGIVDSISSTDGDDASDFFFMQNIRLNLVMKMAEVITKALYTTYK